MKLETWKKIGQIAKPYPEDSILIVIRTPKGKIEQMRESEAIVRGIREETTLS